MNKEIIESLKKNRKLTAEINFLHLTDGFMRQVNPNIQFDSSDLWDEDVEPNIESMNAKLKELILAGFTVEIFDVEVE